MSDEQPTCVAPAIPDAAELHIFETERVRFRREQSRLQLSADGGEWLEVTLLRAFPLSEPDHWIAVLNAEGKELGMLRALHGLDRESLAHAREELARRYLIPRIERIRACRVRADMVEWSVETDRGPLTFFMRPTQENVKRPFPQHLVLTDVEGNRYDIPDIAALDEASRKWLEESV